MSISINDYINKYEDDFKHIKTLHGINKAEAIIHIITEILPSLMTDIGKFQGLSGQEKKDAVIQIILDGLHEIIEETNEEALGLYTLLRPLLDKLIDSLIAVENKEIKFNKKPFLKLFSCCTSA